MSKNATPQVNRRAEYREFKNGWTIPVVILAFAIAFTAVLLYMIGLEVDRAQHLKVVDAEVVSVAEYTDIEGGYHYEVYINYYVDSKKYKHTLSDWDEKVQVGDILTISYDERDPDVIKSNQPFTLLIIMETIICLILYALTTYLFVRKKKIDREYKKEKTK